MSLRRIKPIALPKRIAPPASFGAPPQWRWVAPTELLVDASYQRDVSATSRRLIIRMCASFAWNRMKPPIVVEVASGLHVIDGQHTAIAAASINISKIPVIIVGADQTADRARAFVGHNKDHVKVMDLQIHQAMLAAGDADAIDIERVCKRAGVSFRIFTKGAEIGRGETMAYGGVRRLVKRHGVMRARQMLEVLVKADCRPIIAPQIQAVEALIAQDKIAAETLIDVISKFDDRAMVNARAKAATTRVTLWETLRDVWARRAKEIAA